MARNFLPALPSQDVGPKDPRGSEEKAEAGAPKSETRLADPERWVDEYGDYLFKHALVRLRDPTKAEDMVQDTFLVALKAGETFAGRASAKSWLLGILKNKI